MAQPPITLDQRDLAVVLLANALRKDAHLRHSSDHLHLGEPATFTGAQRWRAEASRRYAQGMVDLLAVLFDGGRALANECRNDAERLAFAAES